jgi:hypothetical protein
MSCCCRVPPDHCYLVAQNHNEYKLPCCYRLEITGITEPVYQCGFCPPGCDVQNRTLSLGWTNPGISDAVYTGSVCPGGGFTCWTAKSGLIVNIVGQTIEFTKSLEDAYQIVTLTGTFEFDADDFDLRGHPAITLDKAITQKDPNSNVKVCDYSGIQATLTPVLIQGQGNTCNDFTICQAWNQTPTCTSCYQQAPVRAIVTIPNGWVWTEPGGPFPLPQNSPTRFCDVNGDFVFDNPCAGSWTNGEPVNIPDASRGGLPFTTPNPAYRAITTNFAQVNGICHFVVTMHWSINHQGHCRPSFIWSGSTQRPTGANCGQPSKCHCDQIPEIALNPRPIRGFIDFCRDGRCSWDGQSLRAEFEY